MSCRFYVDRAQRVACIGSACRRAFGSVFSKVDDGVTYVGRGGLCQYMCGDGVDIVRGGSVAHRVGGAGTYQSS